jgi:hypothetical protein
MAPKTKATKQKGRDLQARLKKARELEARFEALLGGHGTTARLARALGRSQSGLHRIWAAKRAIPDELVALAEFLEAMPKDQWPARWRE